MTEFSNNVAFDLDGTLVNLYHVFEQELWNLYGVTIPRHNSFRIVTAPKISNNKIWKAFEAAYKRYKDVPILPGAAELLTKLYEITNEPPMIVTARPRWAATDTYKLVDRFLKIPYNLVLVNDGDNKLDYLGNVDFFVEDRRKTALKMAYADKFVYLPDGHYNQINFHVDNLERINGVHVLIPQVEDLTKVIVRYA